MRAVWLNMMLQCLCGPRDWIVQALTTRNRGECVCCDATQGYQSWCLCSNRAHGVTALKSRLCERETREKSATRGQTSVLAKSLNSVLNHSSLVIMRLSFTFRTQMKIFLMKSEFFVPPLTDTQLALW